MAALYVLETAEVDELWFVPCFKHPFDKPLEPFVDRHHMCELAAAALGPRAQVTDIERELGDASRTLRTVRALEARYPQHSFALVIGSDLVPEIDGWYGADQLRRAVPFIVVGREGQPVGDLPGDTVIKMPAVSSTEIRRALAAAEPIAGLVPRSVLDYIYKKGLFNAREPA